MAREGLEFGVLSREVAVGGQLVNLRGLGGDYEDVFLPLYGAHQAGNAACALAAVEAFLGGGEQPLDLERVLAGFAGVTSPGRLEVVRRSPTVLVDAAHNPAGAQALVDAVQESFGFDRLVGVVAILADKDARGMLEILEPVLDEVVVTRTTSARALDPEELGSVAAQVFGADRVHVAAGPAGRARPGGDPGRVGRLGQPDGRRPRWRRRPGHRIGHDRGRGPAAPRGGLSRCGWPPGSSWWASSSSYSSPASSPGASPTRPAGRCWSSAWSWSRCASRRWPRCTAASVGFVLGSIVQVLLLASTYWIHLMAVVGVVFTALWVVALVQGKRADELRAAAIQARDG